MAKSSFQPEQRFYSLLISLFTRMGLKTSLHPQTRPVHDGAQTRG